MSHDAIRHQQWWATRQVWELTELAFGWRGTLSFPKLEYRVLHQVCTRADCCWWC